MWSFARQTLGLDSEEFWGLTPREFAALTERYQEQQELLNYRAGIAPAAVYNVNRSKRTDPLIDPFVFFGGRKQIESNIERQHRLNMDSWAMLLKPAKT